MPSKFSWIALGAGAYLAFVLTQFPASTAHRWFAPDTLRLAGIEGTLWSGRAALGSVGELGLHEIQWRLQPWSLLFGRVGGQLQTRFANGFLNTEIEATFTRTTLRNLRATTSLSDLRELLPLGGIEGFVSAEFTELRIQDEWPVEAAGEIRLGELAVPPMLSSASGPLISLGNYRVRFVDSPDGVLVGTFEDQGGPLEVSGSVRLSPDRAFVIEGVTRARPEAPVELSRQLEFLPPSPAAPGLRTFALAGSL